MICKTKTEKLIYDAVNQLSTMTNFYEMSMRNEKMTYEEAMKIHEEIAESRKTISDLWNYFNFPDKRE